MSTERKEPDVIISSSGLDVSGGVSVIQNDPDSPSGTWFTTTGSNGSLRVSFPTPTGNPDTGADVQEFRVRLRKDATGGGTPTYSAELRETGGGSALQTLATDAAMDTADPGAVVSLTWDAANLGTADGSAVELLLTFAKGGGGPNERNIEVESAEWNVVYSSGPTQISGTAVGSGAGDAQRVATHPRVGSAVAVASATSLRGLFSTATAVASASVSAGKGALFPRTAAAFASASFSASNVFIRPLSGSVSSVAVVSTDWTGSFFRTGTVAGTGVPSAGIARFLARSASAVASAVVSASDQLVGGAQEIAATAVAVANVSAQVAFTAVRAMSVVALGTASASRVSIFPVQATAAGAASADVSRFPLLVADSVGIASASVSVAMSLFRSGSVTAVGSPSAQVSQVGAGKAVAKKFLVFAFKTLTRFRR